MGQQSEPIEQILERYKVQNDFAAIVVLSVDPKTHLLVSRPQLVKSSLVHQTFGRRLK